MRLASDEFVITVHKLHRMSVIIVRGALDLTNIHVLADAVDHIVYREVPLLLDLTGVRCIDSAGLHFIRQVHDQCAGKHVPFAMVANATVRRLCGLLSLETVIPIFANRTLARDHFVAEWGAH
jgi:anti-anti-sigma factor